MTTEEILQQSTVRGNYVFLPEITLDYNTEYIPVKKRLELIGGKWRGGNVSAFAFEEDPTELLAAIQGETLNLEKDLQLPINEPESNDDTAETQISELSKLSDEIHEEVTELITNIKNNPKTEMSFFKQLEAILGEAEISLTIKSKDDRLTVMIFPKGSAALPKPLVASGTSLELDEGFFELLSGPISKTTGFSSNVQEFEKQADSPKTETVAEKPKKSRAKKEVETPAEIVEETPVNSAEEDATRQKEEEAEKLAKEEEERTKAEQQRVASFEELWAQANELAEKQDFRGAAGVLKQAKRFSLDPEALDVSIKSYIQLALEAEIENY